MTKAQKQKNRAVKESKKPGKAVVTQRSRHEFIGSHEGAVVVEWLEDPKRPPNDQVEQLLALEAQYQSAVAFQKVDAAKAISEFFANVVAHWRLGTAPYIGYDQQGARTFAQIPTANMKKIPPAQSLAFWKAWELMQADLLTRVRRCKRPGCGKWFFAIFDHAVYHSDQCRVQATSNSPEFRERRKKYMRQRRKRQTKGGK